jgi:hypothetical protein
MNQDAGPRGVGGYFFALFGERSPLVFLSVGRLRRK